MEVLLRAGINRDLHQMLTSKTGTRAFLHGVCLEKGLTATWEGKKLLGEGHDTL
jgi:hypothetical protein